MAGTEKGRGPLQFSHATVLPEVTQVPHHKFGKELFFVIRT